MRFIRWLFKSKAEREAERKLDAEIEYVSIAADIYEEMLDSGELCPDCLTKIDAMKMLVSN